MLDEYNKFDDGTVIFQFALYLVVVEKYLRLRMVGHARKLRRALAKASSQANSDTERQ